MMNSKKVGARILACLELESIVNPTSQQEERPLISEVDVSSMGWL
jgi:hypothetical protein